jgi:hypothetical protein
MVRLRRPRCGKGWSDGHEDLVRDVSHNMTKSVADGIMTDLMLRKGMNEVGWAWGTSRHLVNKVLERSLRRLAVPPLHPLHQRV